VYHRGKTATPIRPLAYRRPFAGLLFCALSLAMVSALLFPVHWAEALDFSRLQATLRKLGGNQILFNDWQRLLTESRDLPTADKLRRVNEFFNRRIQFSNDREIWGHSDYWATPMETLARTRGDCEDFTIAKYFTLLNLNIPVEQLRLIYVKARIGGSASDIVQAHMVLAYYPSPDAEPLVLDNLITDIRPAGRRPDLQPVFSFNSQGIFNSAEGGAALGSGGTGQLSRWNDLLQRARGEGFD
jgi:predicted transglutaminase-like cysteine proteinase